MAAADNIRSSQRINAGIPLNDSYFVSVPRKKNDILVTAIHSFLKNSSLYTTSAYSDITVTTVCSIISSIISSSINYIAHRNTVCQ